MDINNDKIGSESNLVQTIDAISKMPGVKVDRKEFLINKFGDYVPSSNLDDFLEKGPIGYGINKESIERIANKIIKKRVNNATLTSAALGMPGGFGMVATIPTDIAQFMRQSLIVSQELAYLFGYDDLWKISNDEEIYQELILLLGAMFGVGQASFGLKALGKSISANIMKKLPNKALTKGVIYPIVKKVSTMIGVKMTKDTFAKGISKSVPVLGGIVSGGITNVTLNKMSNRLLKALMESSFDFSEEQFINEYHTFVEENELEAEYVEV